MKTVSGSVVDSYKFREVSCTELTYIGEMMVGENCYTRRETYPSVILSSTILMCSDPISKQGLCCGRQETNLWHGCNCSISFSRCPTEDLTEKCCTALQLQTWSNVQVA